MSRQKTVQTKEQALLYNELKKLVDRANHRIKAIESVYGKNAWGVRQLTEKLANENLQALTKSGRVKLSKKQTEIQLKAIKKEVESFINAKNVSTLRGIKKAKTGAVETLKVKLGKKDISVSDKEAESLYMIFQDRDVNRITTYVKGSDVILLIEEAREKSWSYETFEEQILAYKKANKGKPNYYILSKLYTKYVVAYRTGNTKYVNDIIDRIDTAKSWEAINYIYERLNQLHNEKKINDNDYYYLSDLLEQKKNEIL